VAPQASARPDILALPSATASRSLGLLAAVATAGMFAGSALHHALPVGNSWAARVSVCLAGEAASADASPGGVVSRGPAFRLCTDAVNSVLAAFQIVGAALALTLCLALVLMAPGWTVRRRRLRPVGTSFPVCTGAAASLAAEFGQGPPELLVGTAAQRDAFSLGLPGRYRIALPPGLMIRARDRQTFDPVLRHELAHLRRHDVPLAWTSRSAPWVLVLLAVVPLAAQVFTGDWDVVGPSAWRFALIAVVVTLGAAAILRSREFEADLSSAAGDEQRTALRAVLGRIGRPPASGRRWLAVHPTAIQRIGVLDEPTRASRVGFVEGFGAALLAALVVPVITGLASDTSSLSALVPIAGPVVAGLLLAPTLGLGLFRDALGRRVAGLPGSPVWPVCLGVAAGVLLGQTASLATVGDGNVGGVRHPALMLVGTVGYLGATMVAGGVASLCALASARLTRWPVVGCCLVLAGIGYGATAAIVEPLTVAWDTFGWAQARMVLAGGLGSNAAAVVGVLALLLVAVLLVAGRRPWASPSWATASRCGSPEVGRTSDGTSWGSALLVAVAAAIGAEAAIVVNRLVRGPVPDAAHAQQRFDLIVWTIAGAAAAAAISLYVGYGRAGIGAAIGVGPAAALVASVLFIAYNTVLGGALTAPFIWASLRMGIGLAVLLVVLVAAVVVPLDGAAPRRGHSPGTVAGDHRPRRWVAVSVLLALCLGAGFGALAMSGAAVLSPLPAPSASPAAAVIPATAAVPTSGTDEAAWYRSTFAPKVQEQVQDAIDAFTTAMEADPKPTAHQVVALIRAEVLPPLTSARTTAQELRPTEPPVIAAHAELLAALDGIIESFQRKVDSGGTAETSAVLGPAVEHWQTWLAAVAAL